MNYHVIYLVVDDTYSGSTSEKIEFITYCERCAINHILLNDKEETWNVIKEFVFPCDHNSTLKEN